MPSVTKLHYKILYYKFFDYYIYNNIRTPKIKVAGGGKELTII